MLVQTKVAAWLAKKGAKLAVVLLALALVASSYALTYYSGRHAVEMEVATEKAELAKKEAELVAKDAQLRIGVAEEATGRRDVILTNNATGLRKLNEAIKAGGTKPSCDLTDDELRALQQIGSE
jgi:hypothetical protein